MSGRALWILPLAFAAACGRIDFQQARHLEDDGDFLRAVKAYERFVARNPGGPRETEALLRAGRIYAQVFGRCDRAVPLLERAARQTSSSQARARKEDWAAQARRELLSCPDFFPVRPGARWVYVDTESGGKNMRLDISVSSGSAREQITGDYFAGEKRFRGYNRSCEKQDWIIWEIDGPARSPILRYPFKAGAAWDAELGGKNVSYRIESDSAAVKTQAGTFSGCLKVRSHPVGEPAWVYDYYCPGVGRVKTTIGVPEGESPNTELAKYRIP